MPYKTREARNEYSKKYYHEHKEKKAAYYKKYYADNKKVLSEKSKKYRALNRGLINEGRVRRLIENPGLDHDYYLSRQEYIKAHSRDRYHYRTALIARYKRMKGCLLCGYKACGPALELHHIDGRKGDNVAAIKKSSMAKLKAEIDKCVVLCSNCHREIHAGFTILPPITSSDS